MKCPFMISGKNERGILSRSGGYRNASAGRERRISGYSPGDSYTFGGCVSTMTLAVFGYL
jgi:hypothetical protein